MSMPIPGPGRDSKCTPEVAAELCTLLADGCTVEEAIDAMRAARQRDGRPDDDVPARSTVYLWVTRDKEFAAAYREARAAQAHHRLDVAETEVMRSSVIDRDSAAVAKVRADTLIRLSEKWAAREFGPRQNLAGAADGDPIKSDSTVRIVVVSDWPDETPV